MILNGTINADRLTGLDENDKISGLGGNDSIVGGAGNDELDGNNGNDYILGGLGNDLLIGGADDDYLDGQDGGVPGAVLPEHCRSRPGADQRRNRLGARRRTGHCGRGDQGRDHRQRHRSHPPLLQ